MSVWGSHRLLTRGRGFSVKRGWHAPVRMHVGAPLRFGQDTDVERATEQLSSALQPGIDLCIADFPLAPEPGAWWMPAHFGGSAPSEPERQALDARDAAERRRRDSRTK